MKFMVDQSPLTSKISKISLKSFLDQGFINIDLFISFVLFFLTFIVYIIHLAPSLLMGDYAEAQICSYFLGIMHETGFPVYTWIGHLFTFIPVGDVAYRVNLMSAFFGALTIPVVYRIIRSFTKKPKDGFENFASICGAILGSLTLAFSINYWFCAEEAIYYTLYNFFLVSAILIVQTWAEKRNTKLLYFLSLFIGLSVGYLTNLIFLPSFLVFIFLVDRNVFTNKKTLVSMIGIFIIVYFIPILYLYIRFFQHPVYISDGVDFRNFNGFLDFIFARNDVSNLFAVPLSTGMGKYLTYLNDNVSLIGIGVGAIGTAISMKRNTLCSAFLASIFALNMFCFVLCISPNVNEKLIPSYIIFSIFIGLCLWEILSFFKPPSKYKLSVETENKIKKQSLETGNKIKKQSLEIETRNSFSNSILIILVLLLSAYIPLNSYISHYQVSQPSTDFPYFLSCALKEVPENSTILEQYYIYESLRYLQLISHINPKVNVVNAGPDYLPGFVPKWINRSNVYLFEENQNLMDKYTYIPIFTMPGVRSCYKVVSDLPSFSVIDPVIQHPLHKLLGGKLELIGYNLDQSKEENGFTITSYWQSSDNVTDDYVVALVLIGQNKNVLIDTHAPIYNIFPSTQWMKNEVLEEKYKIIYPPSIKPGTYELVMLGKWRTDNSDTYDTVPLGTVEIKKIDLESALSGNNRVL